MKLCVLIIIDRVLIFIVFTMENIRVQIDGDYDPCDCILQRIDVDGNTVNASINEKVNYAYYKKRLLIFEMVCFIYLFSFCMGSVVTVYKEVKFGNHWPFPSWVIQIILWSYIGFGCVFISVYMFYSYKFSKHGNEQKEGALSTMVSVIIVFASVIGLLTRYFYINNVEDPVSGYNFKRTVQTVLYGYALTLMTIIVKSISNHWSIQKTVILNCHHNKENRFFTNEILNWPHPKVFGFVLLMILCSVSILSVSITIMIVTIGNTNTDIFGSLFYSVNAIWGVTFVSLVLCWILWNFTVVNYKESFLAYFESFFCSSVLHIGIMVMMFMAYKILYWHVPNDILGGEVVPSLKISFMNKIGTMCMISFLFACVGITKTNYLMMGKWPINSKHFVMR